MKLFLFRYSLLRSSANVFLKLISVLMFSAYAKSVSINLLSISIMLLRYSLGKLKYVSTTLPISGFLGPSSDSASKSTVFLRIVIFLLNYFSVWVRFTSLSVKIIHRRTRRMHI